MITAVVTRSPDGRGHFRIEGHSGYAPRGGDIVCAAVSAVVQTAVLGLKATPGIAVEDHTGDGYLECRISKIESIEAKTRADAIIGAMVLGLKSIEAGHRKYLRVETCDIEEVSS